jgi:anti-sigma factor RsiW
MNPVANPMNCAEFEILLADYIDGTLAPAQISAFNSHRESCAACALLAADAGSGVAFMERAAAVEPPPELIGRILHATGSGWELRKRGPGLRGWINRAFAPVLQPRFVMGALLTLMSLTMLTRGLPARPMTAADLDPVRIWSALDARTHRIWDRAVKTYESMRLVYEVRSQLNEWSEQQKEAEEAAADQRAASRVIEPAKTGNQKGK